MPIGERLRLAAACGYDSTSALPTEIAKNPRRLRTLAESLGIELIALDPLVSWLPDWEPLPGACGDSVRQAFMTAMNGLDVSRVLQIAASSGCTGVSAVEPYGRRVPVDRGGVAFAALCDQAAEHGLVVRLEPMPYSGIPDYESALSIIRAAGRANSGLVLDTWHFFRGGSSLPLLDDLPLEHLVVQLSDAPAAPEPDLWAEASQRRLLPGAGALDLRGVLKALRERGFSGPVGPEVVSTGLWSLGAAEAARQAAAACRALLDASP
ncbi:sugar phosphate isomerase/epimerase family protein [Amycolatopsis sp. 3B14]|uniref:sugar phosphate isomerase/epimerase family protein n=1 Tax=Amycolatopsis sp. 3B14 TaxID=3243600 RepID=UPI003D98F889